MKKSIREAIGLYIAELGEENRQIVIVNADLMGTCKNSGFVEKFPQRSYNVGIAEQNMVSFAAGLAHEGFEPYVFSMAPFISMRACEQCRTDVAYSNLNVRLIATYAGCSGGISGATHWALEDCGIMCSMAGMTVLEPSDAIQAKKMLEDTVGFSGPVYLRSSVELVEDIYDDDYIFEIGKASLPRYGDDGAFICAGVTVKYAIEAAELIKEKTGKEIRVIDMHTIKPIDRSAIIDAAKTGNIIVAHDHNIIGGLGYNVASVLAEEKLLVNFKMLGIRDEFSIMAHAPYLYEKYEYDVKGLVNNMLELLEK